MIVYNIIIINDKIRYINTEFNNKSVQVDAC